jgi:hypothetical protein
VPWAATDPSDDAVPAEGDAAPVCPTGVADTAPAIVGVIGNGLTDEAALAAFEAAFAACVVVAACCVDDLRDEGLGPATAEAGAAPAVSETADPVATAGEPVIIAATAAGEIGGTACSPFDIDDNTVASGCAFVAESTERRVGKRYLLATELAAWIKLDMIGRAAAACGLVFTAGKAATGCASTGVAWPASEGNAAVPACEDSPAVFAGAESSTASLLARAGWHATDAFRGVTAALPGATFLEADRDNTSLWDATGGCGAAAVAVVDVDVAPATDGAETAALADAVVVEPLFFDRRDWNSRVQAFPRSFAVEPPRPSPPTDCCVPLAAPGSACGVAAAWSPLEADDTGSGIRTGIIAMPPFRLVAWCYHFRQGSKRT